MDYAALDERVDIALGVGFPHRFPGMDETFTGVLLNGIAFHCLCLLPFYQFRQVPCCLRGSEEIRDAPFRTREKSNARFFHLPPNLLAKSLLYPFRLSDHCLHPFSSKRWGNHLGCHFNCRKRRHFRH